MSQQEERQTIDSHELTKKVIGKTSYELSFEAIRIVGAGNAAGLLASAAAIGSAFDKHVPLTGLKVSALSFALGIASFSFAYFFYYSAVSSIDSAYRDSVEAVRAGKPVPDPGERAGESARLAVYMIYGSTILFFVGLMISMYMLLHL
ncbi:hypothetical protein L6654_16850 [Bradyrhizobium sp. WYCCWR 13023]|uniref:Uncharacterized protein n=1 Tax=Bradyrhizobium zhengyangense TaxID=2911009 RepID=A0A9X1RB07_9BRAD|nr:MULTISPECIES: hypothetical protein [Bradyrhizobium]MCG2628302.1 hypothetical protein [Bradyrhizobium zhengyangense]MCG2665584.1 hypothetical protein [Bradyrhizobium zhengyangense]MDA9521286.1 hypothetical protein [Bradyrhizobium sp. CCBAU 11434]